MYFQYSGDELIGFHLDDVQYFYIKNPNGDIVGITDYDGNLIAEYEYDEWGKLLSITTAEEGNEEQLRIANANPFRYRGYYYDSETGYYYLQSRYYNPEWGRFISADDFNYIDNDKLSKNAYIYCENDVINCEDPSGNSKVVNLKNGWKYRIDPENTNTKTKRHIHIYNGKDSYSQNDDGSPHDGSSGSPPKSVRKEVKEKSGWNWDEKEKSYNDSKNNSNSSEFHFGDATSTVVIVILVVLGVSTGVGLFILLLLLALETKPPIGLPV